MLQKSLRNEEQPICADVWREKYRHGDEPDYDATCARVVDALCEYESAEFRAQALRAMRAREVVPAGRVLAGAGTGKRVTLINCFVSPDIQDSMRTDPDLPGLGIMDALSVGSYTQQMGGGIGMDFSPVRPRLAVVQNTGSVSSGVMPFMDMWDAMCATIRSAGSRRGAMMGTLGVWHPDIEEFIEAKQRPGRLTNFNVSVLVTDEFMEAVKNDEKWDLHFPVARCDGKFGWTSEGGSGKLIGLDPPSYIYGVVRARELWDKITAATYVHAEPGVIFIDRVNQQNNLSYCEHIHATNPCGEQPLPADGCCDLGHTNLAVMVDEPFTPQAKFDYNKLRRAAAIMVRLLDNVLDTTLWPTEEQAEEARQKRRIGLGFTGLASALQQLGVPYGSEEAVGITGTIVGVQASAAYRESVQLAQDRGPFPLFDEDKFCDAFFVRKLHQDIRASIRRHGIRNGVLLSVAPTGTTSLVVGNVSSGIEPVFAHRYKRRVRDDSGELAREYEVYDYGYLKYCDLTGHDPEDDKPEAGLPRGFVTADQLTVDQHLAMAAAAQEWTDAAISKTINCPESMTLDEFRQVYTKAYELGLKGCTTYRPNRDSGRGAVLEAPAPQLYPADRLSVAEALVKMAKSPIDLRNDPYIKQLAKAGAATTPSDDVVRDVISFLPADKIPMQDVVEGRRYRIKWPTEDCSYYLMITDYVDPSGRRRPFELFVSTKSERHSEWVKAFSLLVTAIFRREGDPSFVVEELKSVFSASGGTWVRVPWADKPKLATSLVAAIGLKIEEHMRWLSMMGEGEALAAPEAPREETMPAQDLLDVCAHCGARAVIYAEGCATCHACGASDCG